ncbi:hypothetical protein [Leptospira sp. GIMC2001]|uniref:hypothetical protein n=1 Tax=Leptospira sp. GIMC2001 TaxID=1513297 RepID=UPI002349F158|nr:hypothetical protein [Leptospira sp. GIMC2001]WCL49372.1 hypothetical protein O4O04_19095 [Leptospira sp. GIMC2001]
MNYNQIFLYRRRIINIKVCAFIFGIAQLYTCALPSLDDPLEYLIQNIIIRSSQNTQVDSNIDNGAVDGTQDEDEDEAVVNQVVANGKDLILTGYYDGNAKIMRVRQDGTIDSSWTKVFDLDGVPGTTNLGHDFFRNVACSSNGDVYIAGVFKGPSSSLDLNTIVKKFDKTGGASPGWDKTINLYVEYDDPWSLTFDQDENVYLSTRNNSATFTGQGRIFKYQPDGTAFGAPWPLVIPSVSAHNFCGGVSVDSNGNIFAGCAYYSATSSTAGNNAWWIRKWDPTLNEDTTNFDLRINNPLGNTGGWHNLPYVSILDQDENFIVGGHMKSAGVTDNDAWYVRKFNRDTGATIWAHSWDIKTNLAYDSEAVRALAVDSDNNTYVVGSLNSVNGDLTKHRWAIKKLDVAGIPIPAWTKIIESPTASPDGHSYVFSVKIADDGKVYMAGSWGTGPGTTGGKGRIIRFNPDGTEDTTFDPGILDIAIRGMELCNN